MGRARTRSKALILIEPWRRSPSPVEEFECKQGELWPYEIVGEAVGYESELRYEIQWGGWSRDDGTNTTWSRRDNVWHKLGSENEDWIEDSAKDAWDKSQQLYRKAMARKDLEIQLWTSNDFVNTPTYLRQQSYDEKLDRAHAEPYESMTLKMQRRSARAGKEKAVPEEEEESSLFSDTAEETPPPPRSSKRSRTSTGSLKTMNLRDLSRSSAGLPPLASTSQSRIIVAAQTPRKVIKLSKDDTPRTSAQGRSRPETPQTVPMANRKVTTPQIIQVVTGKASTPRAPERMRRADTMPQFPITPARFTRPVSMDPMINRHSKTPSSEVNMRFLEMRRRQGEEWTNKAREATGDTTGRITFVNDVDKEVLPRHLRHFSYLENSYSIPPELKNSIVPPSEIQQFLTGCDCVSCIRPVDCECQRDSPLRDKRGRRSFAYDKNGRYLSGISQPGNVVVECGPNCACDESCRNRIAQLPRTLPIEIFKTSNRGWGVRSSSGVQEGQVLGIYTGSLVLRDKADGAFCFDLDHQAGGDSDSDSDTANEKYSVDGETFGNWTRFLNHSCAPNLEVFLAVWDNIPETPTPYIVFVAREDIDAYTEFTFDYVSSDDSERPPNAMDCFCGVEECRGWLSSH